MVNFAIVCSRHWRERAQERAQSTGGEPEQQPPDASVPEGVGGGVRDRHRAHRQPHRRFAGGASDGRGRRRLENRRVIFPLLRQHQQKYKLFYTVVISRRSVSEPDGREFNMLHPRLYLWIAVEMSNFFCLNIYLFYSVYFYTKQTTKGALGYEMRLQILYLYTLMLYLYIYI